MKPWAKAQGEREGRGGRPWRRLRDRVMQRDGGLCQECRRAGLVTAATDVDHIQSLSAGGADDESNLQALCSACHQAKTQAEARRGRGGSQMFAPPTPDTVPPASFLRARVSGVGGVELGDVQAPALGGA